MPARSALSSTAMLEAAPASDRCIAVTFSEPGTADIDNLYARIGDCGAAHHLRRPYRRGAARRRERAGRHGAFSGDVKDGFLYGRGAVDMKGGIACSVAAVLDYLAPMTASPKARSRS